MNSRVKWLVSTVLYLSLASTALSMSEEFVEKTNMVHQNCQKETGVPEGLIQDCRHGKFAEDNRLKCYLKCVLKQMAVMDEDEGTIDEEGVAALLPDEYRERGIVALKKCGTQRGVNICDTAFQTHKCWQAADPEEYFLP